MWVITDRGFFSAVEHRGDPNMIMVRARVRGDLVELGKLVGTPEDLPRPKIERTDDADYPYRVTITRVEWSRALVQLSERIDYDNFKDSVTRRQGHPRHELYMRVWGVLRGLENLGRSRGRRGSRYGAYEELRFPHEY